MPKPSQRLVTVVILMVILLVVGLLAGLLARMMRKRPFFSPAPNVVVLHDLGRATNYLKLLDPDHAWRAFSVSNGTTRTLSYTATEVEYHTAEGWLSAGSWLSNTLTKASLMTRRETGGEIPPGTTDVFYATIATSSVPWRLRVGCFEYGWEDSLDASIRKAKGVIWKLPPPASKSWSGRRYELISEEIRP